MRTSKATLAFFMTAILATFFASPANVLADSKCRGCEAIEAISIKMKSFASTPKNSTGGSAVEAEAEAKAGLIATAAEALSEMRRTAEGTLKKAQAIEVVEMLRAGRKLEPIGYQRIIEENHVLFLDGSNEINAQLKTIPPEEGARISEDIFLILSELLQGNDPAFLESKKKRESAKK